MTGIRITVDEYLRILRSADLDDNPVRNTPYGIELGPKVVALYHATADFLDTARTTEGVGYAAARDFLEHMVHSAPVPMEESAEGQAAIRDLLASLSDEETVVSAEKVEQPAAAPAASAPQEFEQADLGKMLDDLQKLAQIATLMQALGIDPTQQQGGAR